MARSMPFPLPSSPRPMAAVAVLALLLWAEPPLAARPLRFDLGLEQEVSRHCQRVLAAGVFHSESLACFPRLRQEVEEALCSVGVGESWLPFAAGFGVGAGGLPPEFPPHAAPPFWPQPVHPALWHRWRAEHCGDSEPTTSIEADWGVARDQPAATQVGLEAYDVVQRTQDAFAAARASAPQSLAGPWEECAGFYRSFVADKPGVVCRLIADGTGPGDELIYFSAWRILPEELTHPLLLPIPRPRLFAPKLRQDLEIEGAQCDGPPWRKGMRVKGNHTLRCRRQGSSAVTFRLSTSKGDCTKSLPELGDPSWQEACAEAGPPDSPPPLPFRLPPLCCLGGD